MTESTERVRSLIEGMREAARSYREGCLPLDRLVWELKSRIGALPGVADPDWVEELRSAWWPLEYVNTVWIESGRSELSDDERRQVDQGLDELVTMLVE